MAENIYSKGTRVWFEDKEQAWISAEVTAVIKSSGDAVKLVFVDERGKVPTYPSLILQLSNSSDTRNLLFILREKISKTASMDYLLYETLRSSRRLMI